MDSLFDWGSRFFSDTSENMTYPVKPGEDYGSTWKNNLPPGLPTWARKTSTKAAAISFVQKEAQQQGLGALFVKAVAQMAKTESQGRFALPAIKFNNNPPSRRPPGEKLITAWGVFQFNRDAWTALVPVSERNSYKSFKPKGDSGCRSSAGCVYPWNSTPEEEISRPIKRYAELFREIKNAGGSDIDGAVGLRLWHISPVGLYKPWLGIGRRSGFRAAWDSLSSSKKLRILSFIKNAGISSNLTLEFKGILDDEFFDSIIGGANSLFRGNKIEDRTSFSPKSKRIKEREISSVYALVLHQMGFNRGNDPQKYDQVKAHFVILQNGKIYQLHPLTSYLYSSGGFNKGSVAVEFAGNFKSIRGRCYRPERFGCHNLTPAQIESGRFIVKHLIDKIGLTHVLAHRQSSGSRGNDPGPEIWKSIGQWAIDNYGMNDGGDGFKVGSGQPIPNEWRAYKATSG